MNLLIWQIIYLHEFLCKFLLLLYWKKEADGLKDQIDPSLSENISI